MKLYDKDILYEDNHLLAVNKPGGILTQPSGTDQENLEAMAKTWLKEKYHKPGNVFLEAVHRIDRPVCGVVLFAKTSKALSRLQEALRTGKTTKIYHAHVEGHPHPAEGTLEHRLLHQEHHAVVDPQGKPSKLTYKMLRKFPDSAIVEIMLITGRYHQIRVQFATIGCPVIGDTKYGATTSYHPGSIALQHRRLVIPHPITQELLVMEVDDVFQFQG